MTRPEVILIIVALIGLPSILRRYPEDEQPDLREAYRDGKPHMRAWWF